MSAASAGLRDWRGRPLLVTDAVQAQQEVGALAIIDRAELHRTLRAPLPVELVRTATPVERLEPGPTGVTVISDGAPVARADAVIAADGIGSRLRGQLFPRHPGLRRTGRMDLRGMLPNPPGLDPADLLASQLVDRRSGAMFGLFPVGEKRLYWFTDSALHGPPPGTDEARRQMLSLMADWHPLVTTLIEATPLADIYVDPIARLAEPLPSFAAGRIALLGDAAHAMTPDLGPGLQPGLRGRRRGDPAPDRRRACGCRPSDFLRYDAERGPAPTASCRRRPGNRGLPRRRASTAWARDALLRAIPSRLATRRLAALWRA